MPAPRPAGAILFGLAVSLTVALVAGLVAFTAAAGLIDSMPAAWTAAMIAAVATGWRSATHQPLVATLPSVARAFRVAFVSGVLLCLVQLAPLTAFIIDPNVATWRADPWRPWQSRHSCVSCYWVAAEKALDEGLRKMTSALRPWTIDFHVAQNDATVKGSGSHDKTGRHCQPLDPNGKLDIVKHAGFWLRDENGNVTRKFRHICWDGCMFPNEVMGQQKTWNDILGVMLAVRDAHGWD